MAMLLMMGDLRSNGGFSFTAPRLRCWIIFGLLSLGSCSVANDQSLQSSTSSSNTSFESRFRQQHETRKQQPRMHWKSRGVGGGGSLFAPTINPHQGQEIYMSSDMTGVYHTQDFGRSWETLPFYIMQGYHRSYVRFTSDAHVVYALNLPELPLGPRGIIKSTDRGKTWNATVTTPGDPDDANNLIVDPGSTKRVLYADTHRLYFSRDGGLTFSEIYATPWPEGLVVAGAHFTGGNIYVATSDGVLASHDGGRNFGSELDLGIPADESIVSFAGARCGRTTRFFAVTLKNQDSDGLRTIHADITPGDWYLAGGVYRITLGESSWQRTALNLSANEKVTVVATAENTPNIAYLSGSDRTGDIDPDAILTPIVLKTEDGGNSWKHVFLSKGNVNITTGWSGTNGDTDWYWGEGAFGLAVSPSDPDRVVMTDMGFVHASDDGGRHWHQAYVDPRDENPEGQATPKGKFYRTSGVEQTSCWWLTWGDPLTIFASFTDFTSVLSKDGGKSWMRDSLNGLRDNTTYHVVTHPVTGVWYGATSSVHDIYQSPFMRDSRLDGSTGTVVASSDQGTHWNVVYDFQHAVIWLALDPNRPDQLYASVVHSQFGGIYRLDLEHLDQGATMLPPPPRTKGHAYNVHVLHDGSIVATYSGHQDGNSRVFTDRSGVFMLPPGATVWEDRSAPEMHYWTKDLVVDPRDEDRWYVGVFSHEQEEEFGGLYRTTNRGLTWQRISTRWRVESCAIDPHDPDRMYMTTQGEGLWLTEDLQQNQPVFKQIQDYPFYQPMRLFWNPYDHKEVWTVSFGGGMRVARE
jgi:photosystem II stability/assembly factor-like uncharacterized protein